MKHRGIVKLFTVDDRILFENDAAEALLRELGLFILVFSNMEADFASILGLLAELKHPAGTILITHMNWPGRRDAVCALMDAIFPGSEAEAEMREIINEIEAIQTERNSLMHHVWTNEGTTQLSKKARSRLRVASIDRSAAQIHDFTVRAANAVCYLIEWRMAYLDAARHPRPRQPT